MTKRQERTFLTAVTTMQKVKLSLSTHGEKWRSIWDVLSMTNNTTLNSVVRDFKCNEKTLKYVPYIQSPYRIANDNLKARCLTMFPMKPEHRKKEKDKKCALIANGPSLNKIRWHWQHHFDYVMGMNKIFLGTQRFNLSLGGYVAINPFVLQQSRDEILKMQVKEKYIPGELSNLFPCNNPALKYVDLINSHNEVEFSTSHLRVHSGFTVTYVALQLLYQMNCNVVMIVGLDHSFQQSGNPGDTQVLNGADPNHFDPNYFAGKNWQLAGINESEYHYKKAEVAYRKAGRHIFDATLKGKCNVFEKKSIDEVLNFIATPRL